jgi:hypothetical protein
MKNNYQAQKKKDSANFGGDRFFMFIYRKTLAVTRKRRYNNKNDRKKNNIVI